MKDRILQIMQIEGLSNVEFDEKLRIPPHPCPTYSADATNLALR